MKAWAIDAEVQGSKADMSVYCTTTEMSKFLKAIVQIDHSENQQQLTTNAFKQVIQLVANADNHYQYDPTQNCKQLRIVLCV